MKPLTDSEQHAMILLMSAWDMYVSSLLGFNAHPGTSKYPSKEKSLEEIAEIADNMLKLRLQRFPIMQTSENEHEEIPKSSEDS